MFMKLEDILISDDITKSIYNNFDELIKLIPEIKDMIGFDHINPGHHLDVWNHTLKTLEISENSFEIRLVLLLHDIGKPHCYKVIDGIRRYKGHPIKSSLMSFEILKRLGYNEEFIGKICYLIKVHDDLITDEDINNDYQTCLLRYKIQYCDGMAHHPNTLDRRKEYFSRMRKKLNVNK